MTRPFEMASEAKLFITSGSDRSICFPRPVFRFFEREAFLEGGSRVCRCFPVSYRSWRVFRRGLLRYASLGGSDAAERCSGNMRRRFFCRELSSSGESGKATTDL